MKIIYLAILAICVFNSCKKEDPINEQEINTAGTRVTYDGFIDYGDNSTIKTQDGNFVICGRTTTEAGLVFKVNPAGELIWRKEILPDSGGIETSCIVELSNGDIIVGGHNYFTMNSDIVLIKLSAQGTIKWAKTYAGINFESSRNMIKTSDGNLLLAGTSTVYLQGPNFYLFKFDSDGDTIWTRVYDDISTEYTTDLIETADGNYVISGSNFDNVSTNPYLIKVNTTGTLLWARTYMFATGIINSITELPGGDLLSCGNGSYYPVSYSIFMRMNSSGDTIWTRTPGDSSVNPNNGAYSIKYYSDNLFYTAGSMTGVPETDKDNMFAAIDGSGNHLWYNKFGSSQQNTGLNLIIDAGRFYITGQSGNYIYFARSDLNGRFQ